MTHRNFTALAAALTLLFNTGCATILAGGPSELTVNVAEPKEPVTTIVKGVANDEHVVRHETNFKVLLDRLSPYAVSISSDGYRPELAVVKLEVNPAYWLNLLPLTLGLGYLVWAAGSGSSSTASSAAAVSAGANLVTLAGALVDIVTKNAYRHGTNQLDVKLTKAKPAER